MQVDGDLFFGRKTLLPVLIFMDNNMEILGAVVLSGLWKSAIVFIFLSQGA